MRPAAGEADKVPETMHKTENSQKLHGSFWAPIILCVIVTACLAPFLGKPYHIDDPLFLWTARQIHAHPLDFYGFPVNWYKTGMAMSEVMKNPPLASYYIALVAYFFGWAETTLHLAFLVPALAAALGTYFLAKRLCLSPLIAALIGVLTPGFLLSGTTVMSDTMMLAMWLWAMVVWMRSLENDSASGLAVAALLIGLCSLTKYYGMCLIPLVFVYTIVKKRSIGTWAVYLLIPVSILAGYQWYTYALYGRGLLLDASDYAMRWQKYEEGRLLLKVIASLAFTGGCFISVLFFSFLLWSWRTLSVGALTALILIGAASLVHLPEKSEALFYTAAGMNWPFLIQCFVFTFSGIGILLLATRDLLKNRNAESLLLFLWTGGTFVFAGFINWTVNGRSLLPIAPVIGILVVRRLQQNRSLPNGRGVWRILPALIPALFVALSVTWADYTLANAARTEASFFSNQTGRPGTLWFQGHWGFQYYMEENGGKPLDVDAFNVAQGDIVVIPSNNSNLFSFPTSSFTIFDASRIPVMSWLTTMSIPLGAGFYSDIWGPLPYAIGSPPADGYLILLAVKPLQ